MDIAADAKAKGKTFAANLARSIRITREQLGTGVIHASADREGRRSEFNLHRLRALPGQRRPASRVHSGDL